MQVDSIASLSRQVARCLVLWWCTCGIATAAQAHNPFQSLLPEPTADQILLISTRSAGTSCDPTVLERELVCRRLTVDSAGEPAWVSYDWHHLFRPEAAQLQTVFYVHGNRVSIGSDAGEGMAVYESLVSSRSTASPVRFIIWSWPSSQIPGVIKDYKVKANRTTSVAWQLAWFVDQMLPESPLAMLGYSYGARTVSGTMHLLAGGQLEGLRLSHRAYPQRPPARVALMAAAFDADWLQPGEDHGLALRQMEDVVIGTNRHDPAMRFFHLSTKHSRVDALGLAGILNPRSLKQDLQKVHYVDFTKVVGRSHVVFDYLEASYPMRQVWAHLLDQPAIAGDALVPAYANLPTSARR